MPLRHFDEKHIDEDCRRLTGNHENGLFFSCTFENLNGLTLKGCDLNRSTFDVRHVKDALDFTLTLGCHSFKDVQYSPLLFDLLLCLMTMTKGNDEKRKQLLDVIGHDKAEAFYRLMKELE